MATMALRGLTAYSIWVFVFNYFPWQHYQCSLQFRNLLQNIFTHLATSIYSTWDFMCDRPFQILIIYFLFGQFKKNNLHECIKEIVLIHAIKFVWPYYKLGCILSIKPTLCRNRCQYLVKAIRKNVIKILTCLVSCTIRLHAQHFLQIVIPVMNLHHNHSHLAFRYTVEPFF